MATAKSFRDLVQRVGAEQQRLPGEIELMNDQQRGHLLIKSRAGKSGNQLEWLCRCPPVRGPYSRVRFVLTGRWRLLQHRWLQCTVWTR
jgi:hypothetical protein